MNELSAPSIKGYAQCSRCGCLRPAKEMVPGRDLLPECRDAEFCARVLAEAAK